MKTLLFAPLFIDGFERFERNKQWLDYMGKWASRLNYDELYYVDNASNICYLFEFEQLLTPNIKIHKFYSRLLRNTHNAYGYWYSAFAQAIKYAKQNDFDKIVHIDTDVYLLTPQIYEYVNNIRSGWSCFWSEIHQFPESTFQIICKDQFNQAETFFTRDFLKFYPDAMAEKEIPFTNVIKQFKGDRYGEKGLEQSNDMDYYGQKPNNINLVFNAKD